MNFCYARTSTDIQVLTDQVAQRRALVWEAMLCNKTRNMLADCPQMAKLKSKLDFRGIAVIPTVGRFSCERTDVLAAVHKMYYAGFELQSLCQYVMDTTSDLAEPLLFTPGISANMVYNQIIDRAVFKLAYAKLKGVRFGREPKLKPHWKPGARTRIEASEAQRRIACSCNVIQTSVSGLSL